MYLREPTGSCTKWRAQHPPPSTLHPPLALGSPPSENAWSVSRSPLNFALPLRATVTPSITHSIARLTQSLTCLVCRDRGYAGYYQQPVLLQTHTHTYTHTRVVCHPQKEPRLNQDKKSQPANTGIAERGSHKAEIHGRLKSTARSQERRRHRGSDGRTSGLGHVEGASACVLVRVCV